MHDGIYTSTSVYQYNFQINWCDKKNIHWYINDLTYTWVYMYGVLEPYW